MMDTVYGTKKYFQSLSNGNGSDICRSSACRAVANDYSYQNTFGRRSTIGPYQHMNKHPSYSTDLSLSSQYGYNTWGVWRDQRNLAPSIYSTKSRQSNVKSFSIILSTAAFIVILAVISVAALAFYFGTFKSSLDDPIMGFEGSFRVMKGDIYTTGLKYNHTTTYRQKVDYYKRFVERALTDNGLNIARVDIIGFGDGPLIETKFHSFLDMRKIPQNFRSVEEHIRESIMLETNSFKSLYKSIRIDPNSIDVKRILDEDLVKSASFSRDMSISNSQSHFEKRLTKKSGVVEKSNPKLLLSTQKPKIIKTSGNNDDEPDIDVENAPIIQGSFEGSFEITKTDADITRKKSPPTKAVTTATRPSIAMRVKNKKTTIEKVPAPMKTSDSKLAQATRLTTIKKIISTTPVTTTTKKPITTTTTTTTSTTTTTTTEKPKIETTTESTTATPITTPQSPPITVGTTTLPPDSDIKILEQKSSVIDPPKLDANLFISEPVLDTEPWRPIRPPSFTNDKIEDGPLITPQKTNLLSGLNSMFNIPAQSNIEALESGLLPRNKIKFSEPITDNPNDMLFYHSFTNPVFMPGTAGIERLGNSQLKAHDLPLPLLDDVVIPDFKPLNTGPFDSNHQFNLQINENNNDDNDDDEEEEEVFVVVNKPKFDTSIKNETDDDDVIINTTEITEPIHDVTKKVFVKLPVEVDVKDSNQTVESVSPVTELAEKFGELLYDLLELPAADSEDFNKNNKTAVDENLEIESRISSDSMDKPNFLNIKNVILNRTNKPVATSKPASISTTSTSTTLSETFTTRKQRPRPKPGNTRTTPSTIIDDSMLFPTNTKWQNINDNASGSSWASNGVTNKVFNETLQAWIVENDEKRENVTVKDELHRKRNSSAQIQDISLIFDTLATKLGISSSMPIKNPPFSQNKFKQNQNSEIQKPKTSTTTKSDQTYFGLTTSITTAGTTSVPSSLSTSIATSTEGLPTSVAVDYNGDDSDNNNSFENDDGITPDIVTAKSSQPYPMSSDELESLSSPEIIVGEAEIEVIDPNKYEEMLKSSQQPTSASTITATMKSTTESSSLPITLVTLLPVKSNSGIRRSFKNTSNNNNSMMTNANSKRSHQTQQFFAPAFKETIVKAGIHVTV